MALSDSMFLFEIVVEDFKNFMRCKEFIIRSQFADVFTLNLREPNDESWQRKRKFLKPKQKLRNTKKNYKNSSNTHLQSDQSLLLGNNIEWLVSHMSTHPLELSLWSKKYPKKKLGETHIPWSKSYKDYLNKLSINPDLPPVIVNGRYNIVNESLSKCLASITLSIKLKHLQGSDATVLNNSNELKDIISRNDARSDIKMFNEGLHKNDASIKFLHLCEDAPVSNAVAGNRFVNLKKIEEIKDSNLLRIIKSDTQFGNNSPKTILKSTSMSSINVKTRSNPLTYIFGCPKGHFGNRIYCVSYFTIENDVSGKENTPKASNEGIDKPKGRYYLKLCDSQCPMRKDSGSCLQSECSLDLPAEASRLITITKCKQIECDSKNQSEPPSAPDDRILLDLTNLNAECCNFTEKIEEVVGGVTGKVQIGNDPCFCTCECKFGFTKKTTYCTVCGGYEIVGEEFVPTIDNQTPFPCPIFHKLIDKNKLKNWSTSGSESKKKGDDQSVKSMKVSSGQKAAATTKRQVVTKNVESEKDTKKGIMKKKDDRFKFNYGYKGIPPQIGHGECAMPCSGTLSNVPKNMGWLWTAEDIPGMKFRPMWKPGAVNKHVLRLLRMAKNPGEVIAKKRRKDAGKKKRSLKRPLLIVHKKDGEYSVTMETMKAYTKPRAPNQQPYEDKPVVTYTIGRTDEENRDRQKKKEREQRRLERQQRQFIQSAFRDMCEEICLQTYQQALGILPGAEDPECSCFTAQSDKVNVDVSCSCSEERSTIGSDTDLDEWIVEFTPPVATFDPTYKWKKIFKADMGTQYTYLDYRVKLLDRFGNPVPRFFKGPDGRQQCSDLGGFWSPDHKWLEINVDGYIAPDGRFAPNNFIGPNGEHVDAESGKFQSANGKWLVVGIDGYVDCVGKWRFYPRPRGTAQIKRPVISGKKKGGAGDKKDQKGAYKQSEASWSCFGDVSPKLLSKMGIVGHGQDKKLLLSKLRDMLAHGEDVRIPQPSTVYRLPESKKSKRARIASHRVKNYLEDRYKCHHPVPSEKGIVATDEHGNKTYFRLKDVKNKRPKERIAHLTSQGISVSSFHLPCFHSFINSEIMKRQQRERLVALAGKSVATQV